MGRRSHMITKMNFYVVIFLLMKEGFFVELDESTNVSRAIVQMHKEDDKEYLCYGGFFTKDKIMTTCKCLGRYGDPDVTKNFEAYFYRAYDPKLLYGVRNDGKRFFGVQSIVYDFCAPSLVHPSLYIHDLAILRVLPDTDGFLNFIKPGVTIINSCMYAMTKKEDETMLELQVVRKNIKSWFQLCRSSKLGSNECEEEMKYLILNDGLGVAEDFKLNTKNKIEHYGSPIVCSGIIIGVLSTLVRQDVYYASLDHRAHYDFIQKVSFARNSKLNSLLLVYIVIHHSWII